MLKGLDIESGLRELTAICERERKLRLLILTWIQLNDNPIDNEHQEKRRLETRATFAKAVGIGGSPETWNNSAYHYADAVRTRRRR